MDCCKLCSLRCMNKINFKIIEILDLFHCTAIRYWYWVYVRLPIDDPDKPYLVSSWNVGRWMHKIKNNAKQNCLMKSIKHFFWILVSGLQTLLTVRLSTLPLDVYQHLEGWINKTTHRALRGVHKSGKW